MNVMPLWRLKEPPTSKDHAFFRDPAWRLVDQDGVVQPLNDHYVIVNPLREDVRDRIVDVAADIVTRYGVDGIHLDYVRFVTDAMDTSKVYPADDQSRAQLKTVTGSDAVDSVAQRSALRGLIRSSITEIVSRIQREAVSKRDGVVLTAAVWRRPDLARDQYEQDAAAWLNAGLIDAAMPMIYTPDTGRYSEDLAAWRAESPGGRVVPGIGTYQHDDGRTTARQIAAAGNRDFVMFAYSSLFKSRAPDQDHGPAGEAERAKRLAPIRAHLLD
jgi:uncharacterized lipoprotein YddW (UPF0748 family)